MPDQSSPVPREYSQRLGALSDGQLQAALDRFDLGKLIDARPAPGGLFGQNVLLRSSKGGFVLRGQAHYDGQFQKERFFSRLIHERTPAEAPWPYMIEKSLETFGWSFAIMPWLEGVQLSDPETQQSLTQDDRIAIAGAMGAYLALLHGSAFDAAAVYDYIADDLKPMPAPFADWIVGEVHMWLDRCLQASHETTPEDVAWVEEIVESARPAIRGDFPPVVVHTDFTEGNVVAAREGGHWSINGVFDLGEAYIGDGEYDLARLMCAYAVPDTGRLFPFVRAYTAVHPLRPHARERLALYVLFDRLIIWEYGQRNSVWFKPGTSLRAFAERLVDAAGVAAG